MQITVKAATTIFGRFAQFFGEPVQTPFDGLDRVAPDAETIADASPQQIIEHLATSGDTWAAGRPQDDDVTFVVLKLKETGAAS